MRHRLFAAVFAATLCAAAAPTNAHAALLPNQVEAVVALLSAFGADPVVIANVRVVLGGGRSTVQSSVGSLVFAPAVQPPSLRVNPGIERMPFTALSLKNNSGAPVEIYTLTIERQGSGSDSNFDTIALIEGNVVVATTSGFDTRHQVNLATRGFTIAAGSSITVTIAGDLSPKSWRSGRTLGLTVVAINASAPVAGTLPITGTLHILD